MAQVYRREKVDEFRGEMTLNENSCKKVTGLKCYFVLPFVRQQHASIWKNHPSRGGHTEHLRFQKMRWERIAAFLKGLKENQLLEKTLVVVVTEFNRSPGRNSNAGKDHNYTDNTIALFGRNINGGKVIGNHKLYTRGQNMPLSIWAGSFINYQNGQVADLDAIVKMQTSKKVTLPEKYDLIRPTDLWATVANSLSPAIVKNLAPESRQIPGLFRK